MGKKKDYLPDTIEDLNEMYYGKNMNGKDLNFEMRKNYEDYIQSGIINQKREQEVRELFSPIGELEKIKRKKGETTIDFKCENEKLIIEVTSLNTPSYQDIEIDIITKMNTAIEHVEEKDTSEFRDYSKGGIIFYSAEFNFFSKIGKIINSINILNETIFPVSKLDFLGFIPDLASIDGRSSRDLFPPVIYVRKKRIQELFTSKLPQFRVIFWGDSWVYARDVQDRLLDAPDVQSEVGRLEL